MSVAMPLVADDDVIVWWLYVHR